MFALTWASDKQAMGRYDDAIVDCKAAIVNDPEVWNSTHLLQICILQIRIDNGIGLNADAGEEANCRSEIID